MDRLRTQEVTSAHLIKGRWVRRVRRRMRLLDCTGKSVGALARIQGGQIQASGKSNVSSEPKVTIFGSFVPEGNSSAQPVVTACLNRARREAMSRLGHHFHIRPDFNFFLRRFAAKLADSSRVLTTQPDTSQSPLEL